MVLCILVKSHKSTMSRRREYEHPVMCSDCAILITLAPSSPVMEKQRES